MIASEVPIHNCMRRASGTWMTPKTSYRTGTMTPPPPMPNRPARMPVPTPPARLSSTSQAISPSGYPSSMTVRGWPCEKAGGDVRQFGAAVQHQRQRISHDGGRGAGLDRLGRQMAAEGACARHGAAQAEHVARDAGEAHARRRRAHEKGAPRGRGLQSTTDSPLLLPVGRTTSIQVDLDIAEVGADPRGLGQRPRRGTAQLERDRLLDRSEAHQPHASAMQDGAGREHLGLEQRAPRHETVEEPAVPVGPVHLRSDAEASRGARFIVICQHLKAIKRTILRPAQAGSRTDRYTRARHI